MSTTPNPAAGFELTLADGSVVKADNVEEAIKIVAKMKTDTSSALKEERTKREEMEQRLNAMQAELQQRNAPAKAQEGTFDRDHYFRLVGEDPMLAQNYLDAHRFGIADPSQVVPYFQGMYSTVTNLEQNTLAASFINSHPEFPSDAANAQILTQEVMRLRNLGHPVTMDTLNVAWQNCVANDSITPVEAKQEPDDPNPSLGGGGAGTLDAESSRVEQDVISGKMSMTDFEKYLKSKGMLGV